MRRLGVRLAKKKRSDEIKVIMKTLEEMSSEMIQDATLMLHGELVKDPRANGGIGTPIDTGYASASWWFATTSLPARQTKNGTVEESLAKQNQSKVSILTYSLKDGSTFVYNDTEYIEYLLWGSSKQAPAGFNWDAIDKVTKAINEKYDKKVYEV